MFRSLIAIAYLSSASAGAAVVDSEPGGFAVQLAAHAATGPLKVYAALLEPSKWWNPEHTYSGDAANLSLDAQAGGCLCEKLPDGGFVQHLVVIYAAPGKTLRFKGALGPFQGHGVDGALTFRLSPKDGGTDIFLDDINGGFMKGGFGDWPGKADGMLADLLGRLKRYAETGKPP